MSGSSISLPFATATTFPAVGPSSFIIARAQTSNWFKERSSILEDAYKICFMYSSSPTTKVHAKPFSGILPKSSAKFFSSTRYTLDVNTITNFSYVMKESPAKAGFFYLEWICFILFTELCIYSKGSNSKSKKENLQKKITYLFYFFYPLDNRNQSVRL